MYIEYTNQNGLGVPNTASQRTGALLHHTLGNGDFKVFYHMSRQITASAVMLTDIDRASAEIDQALQICYVQARPVYIALPTDFVHKKVSSKPLDTPLNIQVPKNDIDAENEVMAHLKNAIAKSQSPIIIVDACTIRHRVKDNVRRFVKKTGFRVFTTPMGKSAISETIPNFCGTYIGSVSVPEVREQVESSDLAISIGALKSGNLIKLMYFVS